MIQSSRTLALLAIVTALLSACASSSRHSAEAGSNPAVIQELSAPMTRDRQARVTPDIALQRLRDGNHRFVHGQMLPRDLPAQVKVTGHGQFPFASVVTCIDSRAAPELVFDQGVGDVFTARVAGNIVNQDILGSLEYAAKVAGSKLIVVLGHSHCGAIKGACDDVKMGNLTGLVEKIKPAVSAIPRDGSPRNSANHEFVEKVAEANVELTVHNLLEGSPLLKDMVRNNQIAVVGAMLDVETGEVHFLTGNHGIRTAANQH